MGDILNAADTIVEMIWFARGIWRTSRCHRPGMILFRKLKSPARWHSLMLPVFSLFLLQVWFPSAGSAQTRRAVLVGIDKYNPCGEESDSSAAQGSRKVNAPDLAPERSYCSDWHNLQGSINDVEAMKAILMARYSFDRKNIYVLENEQATRKNIVDAIEKHLIEEPAPGDVVLFYYAGHGSQVPNSKSHETPPKDETIVPSDANRGALDIRDKEFARWLNRMLDKKLVVTAIFDSCHSGSIARGVGVPRITRFLADSNRDSKDDYNGPAPEDRGALVLSATQASLGAFEDPDAQIGKAPPVPHGAFTAALLAVLSAAPVNMPVADLYRIVNSRLQARFPDQLPVLAGKDLKSRPLFGAYSPGRTGAVRLAVTEINGGSITLDGGLAVGLSAGCELHKLSERKDAPEIRLKVTTADSLSVARAQIIRGDPSAIKVGDLFELDKWVAGSRARLRVWLPSAPLSPEEILRAVKTASNLQRSAGLDWIEDPTDPKAKSLTQIYWSGAGWILFQPPSSLRNVGTKLVNALNLNATTRGNAGRPQFFLSLPPTTELASALRLGRDSINSAIDVTTQQDAADYLLVGRNSERGLEYAWVMPNRTQHQAENSPYPARTDWVSIGGDNESVAAAAQQLAELALRLARIHGWMNLQSSADDRSFPYSLALKPAGCGQNCKEYRKDGVLAEGEKYGIVLQARPQDAQDWVHPRWVYVFDVDSWGKGTLLFPPPSRGNEEKVNYLPIKGIWKDEIPLSDPDAISINSPFGTDTLILLVSQSRINDLSVFEFSGARTRGEVERKPGENPLEDLLASIGSSARGMEASTPMDWWIIQRLNFRTVAKSPE